MVQNIVALLTRFIPRTLLQRVAHVGLKSISWFYAGSTFEDPIDGRTYRKMLPYGRVRSRPNALAPHSLSLERHRALWLFLLEFSDFFSEGVSIHPKKLSGLNLIAIRLLQSQLDKWPLHRPYQRIV